MRDHTKLRAFELADKMAVLVYRCTATFPREELFGMTTQMRRAAVSVASNIVEGCARDSQLDYARFVDMAYASARELQYQVSLAQRLRFLKAEQGQELEQLAVETAKVLAGLLRALKRKPAQVPPRATAK